MNSAFDQNPEFKAGDRIITTCFGDNQSTGKVLDTPAVNLVRVRLDSWTKEDIDRFGGEDEAWIIFSNDQVKLFR